MQKLFTGQMDGAAYTGDTLMHAGVLLPKSWGDYYPVSMYFISE